MVEHPPMVAIVVPSKGAEPAEKVVMDEEVQIVTDGDEKKVLKY